MTPAFSGKFVGLLHFKVDFRHRRPAQAHVNLSVIRQPELVEGDFVGKRVEQTAIVQEFGCSKRTSRSLFCFDETATFSASSREGS